VGATVAKVLAEHFLSIDDLINTDPDKLQKVPEIGPKIAGSIHDFFGNEHNRKIIDRLREAGLKMSASGKAKSGVFANKTIVLTGTLNDMAREKVKELIEQEGGKTADVVSKKIDILIAGDDPGSKLRKAKELGIEIWDEEKFLSVIHQKKVR